MQIRDRTREALLAGREVRGQFALLGTDATTPGTLSWSFETGAELHLIGPTAEWGAELGRFDGTVNGILDGRDVVTLIAAGVTSVDGFGGTARRVHASTLALGEHVDATTRWPRAIYSTTNLSEWVQETGLRPQFPTKPSAPRGVLWEPPARHEFSLPRAAAALVGRAEFGPVGLVSSWSVSTRSTLVVNIRRPSTMNDLYERYAVPLVSFTAFVADRPDNVDFEVLVDEHARRRVEVWRRGPRFESRQWDPMHGFLCRGHDLPRLTAGLRSWWRLHAKVWPALGVFAEHITTGGTYTPARFLTLFAAMEAYCRVRLGKKDFRLMREYAGVEDDVHGCHREGLAAIGISRKHFSHYGTVAPDQAQMVSDKLMEITRCAHALMQACLLRELGFGHRQAARLLNDHYRNWPIPDLSS